MWQVVDEESIVDMLKYRGFDGRGMPFEGMEEEVRKKRVLRLNVAYPPLPYGSVRP